MENTTNELDNPTELNKTPATTGEIINHLRGMSPEDTRKRSFIAAELVKLEREAWDHELDAEYIEAVAIPPVQQAIDQNRIAIARHEEIIQEINNSGSHTRADRERRKASEEDIKLLQKDNTQREALKAQLKKGADGRRNQATEVRLHMKFLADKFKDLFTFEPEPETED
jgi:hypothetical protein